MIKAKLKDSNNPLNLLKPLSFLNELTIPTNFIKPVGLIIDLVDIGTNFIGNLNDKRQISPNISPLNQSSSKISKYI